MSTGPSFRDLDVWQESMLLVEDIYRITRRFPREERYGLTSQLRDAAVSIASNTGEGARRKREIPNRSHLADAEWFDCFATARQPLFGRNVRVNYQPLTTNH